ncbi:MAG TPA: TIGR00730 family Rossman fold protein [Actinomycetota bacterium]|nr:TIGR00730 family Rossman fold protein [Actinomycetota bacterium]
MKHTTGDPYVDERLRELVSGLNQYDAQLVFEMMASALALAKDPISRLDRKIANTALKEMRYAFNVFAPYRNVRKATIFGSSRTAKGAPEYALARDVSRTLADRGWMIVTGAGPGIMEAGHEGAGGDRSFGVNILLPFEATANPYIAGDPKLINFKYFFTRKLMFIKESDAFVLMPGGFGTLDEAFELLTLIQTGKSDLHPIVMLDVPGGTYWKSFDRYLREELLANGYISDSDLALFTYTDDIEQAVTEIERFYRVYHSQRYVNDRLVLRLNSMPPAGRLKQISDEFADILEGPIEPAEPSSGEIRDDDVVHLPRILLNFDRIHAGRLRMLVDRLNDTAL